MARRLRARQQGRIGTLEQGVAGAHLDDRSAPLRHGAALRLYLGAAEIPARMLSRRQVPIAPVFTLTMRNEIADWLTRNALVEPIVTARGMDAGAVIRQKMDFILVDAADRLGLDIGDARRTELRKVAYSLGDALPAEFQGLGALLRWVESKGDWPRITSEHPAYFYSFRATPGPLRDLVNMLLAELSPLDVRQLFIMHKELFYASYARWSDRKRQYVADFLEREYKVDAQGVRRGS